MTPLTIVIADDHPVVRDGIRAMLSSQEGVDVIGVAGTAPEALAVVQRTRPDVLLTDLHLPGSGVTLIAQVRAQVPDVHVVVLSTFSGEDDVVPALEAGAQGYLLKDIGRVELTQALRDVVAGQTRLAAGVSETLVASMRKPMDGLAPRERQVLALVADGATNRQIARRLLISEATVKTHLQHLYAKLDVGDRAAAVSTGYQRGILP